MSEVKIFKPHGSEEAHQFEKAWCENCRRHAGAAICEVLFDAILNDPEDANYPDEWRLGEAGPECTAFTPMARTLTLVRCAHPDRQFANGESA